MKKSEKVPGYTLIEILMVVFLIVILIGVVVIVAINPQKNLKDARNTTRATDVNQILNAVTQYAYEEGHEIDDLGEISQCSVESDHIGTCSTCLDLSPLLVDEYIVAIPEDPLVGTSEDTGYTICLTQGGRVEVAAPNAEDGIIILVRK
jgi:type II secretory pathway pseudopilin PulG